MATEPHLGGEVNGRRGLKHFAGGCWQLPYIRNLVPTHIGGGAVDHNTMPPSDGEAAYDGPADCNPVDTSVGGGSRHETRAEPSERP